MASHPTHLPRRQTRGLRPWFLIPKILLIGIGFGTIFTILILRQRAASSPAPESQLLTLQRQTHFLLLYVVAPTFAAVALLGVALLLQCPRAFLRMRWMQLKLLILILLIPTAFVLGAPIAIVMLAAVIVLGRLKPRLGQNWAGTWRSIRH